jgi:hypothetical protein
MSKIFIKKILIFFYLFIIITFFNADYVIKNIKKVFYLKDSTCNLNNINFNNAYYYAKVSCLSLASLIKESISRNKEYKLYEERLNGNLKVVGAKQFNNELIVIINNGFFLSISEEFKKINYIIDLNNDKIRYSINAGLISSLIISPNEIYIYYNGLEDKKKKLFIERIVFNNRNVSKKYTKTLFIGEFEEQDLGGGMLLINDSLILGTGRAVGGITHGGLADRVNLKKSIFGKSLKIPLFQFYESDLNINKKEEGILFEVFTIGHKNLSGIISFYGNILSVEHGPTGGDEVNLLENNNDYGWNRVSYGLSFDNLKKKLVLTDNFHNNLKEPIFDFTPSIAPSGVAECPFIDDNEKSSKFMSPCIVISTLRGQGIFFLKFNRDFEAYKNTEFFLKNLRVINVEKFNVFERVRKVISSKNRIIIFSETSKNNIYFIDYVSIYD